MPKTAVFSAPTSYGKTGVVKNTLFLCVEKGFINNCENIVLKNLTIVTGKPNIHKITVLKASNFYVTFKIDEASDFREENGEYYLEIASTSINYQNDNNVFDIYNLCKCNI